MILTLKEVSDTCSCWSKFCELHGVGYYALNEGYGDTVISLTTQQAHHLGIVKIRDTWNVVEFDEVYPPKEDEPQVVFDSMKEAYQAVVYRRWGTDEEDSENRMIKLSQSYPFDQ